MTNKPSIPGIFWWGQIVDDKVWKDNLPSEKWKYANEIPGYGSRYKVAILGRDSKNKDTPDDQLEWADVVYPVTAGSGHGGSYQTSNLRKGSLVFGFYKDGINMTQPIILGCYGNNEQIPLSQSIPLTNFTPFSGYVKEKVSINSISAEGSIPPRRIPFRGPQGVEFKDETKPQEGCNQQNKSTTACQAQKDDGQRKKPISVPTDCSPVQLGKIQTDIKNFIKDIQEFKKQTTSWKNTLLKPISENGQQYSISEYIRYKAQNVSKWISSEIKRLIGNIQKGITNTINNAAKNAYNKIFPNKRSGLKKTVETANDLIACLFRKIISNLLKMITDILLKIAERFINAPLCAIENIIASLIGQLVGFITSAIDAIIKPLEAILGAIFDVAGGILNFIIDLLSFLSCEENPECPQMTEWSPWEGFTKFNLSPNVDNIIGKINTIASNAKNIVDPNNFDFNLNFDSIFQNTCNVGPIFCGPPIVEFYGGGGSGAAGNAIISAAGDILGVDITSFGSGYTSAPIVRFLDNCGSGQGATGVAVINSVPVNDGGTTTGVTQVIMTNPGFDYLSFPNGDRGGDGRVWAESNQTTVQRNDGTYDRPYNSGETFQLNPGDKVYSCGNTITITETQSYTAPECTQTKLPRGEDPSLNNGNYPVFLELDKVYIESPGINYDPNKDRIVVTPNHGAELKPVFDDLGSLKKVDVIKPGIGFTEMPSIEIETESGYNASLLPVLKVNRIGNIPETEIPPETQVISVIDCVGKFNV